MKVSIKDITQDNIIEIPEPSRTCLYWENPNVVKQARALSATEKARCEAEKAAWFFETLKEFGVCGKILYVDDKPIDYAQYTIAKKLPNTQEYGAKGLETSKEIVAFLSCFYISKQSFRRRRLGERFLCEVISDLKKRGFKAVETFARKGSANNPSGPIELYLNARAHLKKDSTSEKR